MTQTREEYERTVAAENDLAGKMQTLLEVILQAQAELWPDDNVHFALVLAGEGGGQLMPSDMNSWSTITGNTADPEVLKQLLVLGLERLMGPDAGEIEADFSYEPGSKKLSRTS